MLYSNQNKLMLDGILVRADGLAECDLVRGGDTYRVVVQLKDFDGIWGLVTNDQLDALIASSEWSSGREIGELFEEIIRSIKDKMMISGASMG